MNKYFIPNNISWNSREILINEKLTKLSDLPYIYKRKQQLKPEDFKPTGAAEESRQLKQSEDIEDNKWFEEVMEDYKHYFEIAKNMCKQAIRRYLLEDRGELATPDKIERILNEILNTPFKNRARDAVINEYMKDIFDEFEMSQERDIVAGGRNSYLDSEGIADIDNTNISWADKDIEEYLSEPVIYDTNLYELIMLNKFLNHSDEKALEKFKHKLGHERAIEQKYSREVQQKREEAAKEEKLTQHKQDTKDQFLKTVEDLYGFSEPSKMEKYDVDKNMEDIFHQLKLMGRQDAIEDIKKHGISNIKNEPWYKEIVGPEVTEEDIRNYEDYDW